MALPGDSAQIVVHRIRITSRQFVGRGDPQLAQIGGDGGTDVRDVFQVSDLSPSFGLFFPLLNHCQLSSPGHRLDRCFLLQCRTLVGTNFLVGQFDRATAAGISGGRASIVLLATAFYVLGDPGVERAISTSHDIHEPFVAGRSGLRLAVLFAIQLKYWLAVLQAAPPASEGEK